MRTAAAGIGCSGGWTPEPGRLAAPATGKDGKPKGYRAYALEGVVSIGTDLGTAIGVDWRAWGGYLRIKQALPAGFRIDALPDVPPVLSRTPAPGRRAAPATGTGIGARAGSRIVRRKTKAKPHGTGAG